MTGSTSAPGGGTPNFRLFVGGGIAYTVQRNGYDTFDLTDRARPVLLTTGDTTQVGWKQIVANGSGLGLAVVRPNFNDESKRDISLYELSDPHKNDVFLTQFTTPGIARAVALFDGLAYVADDAAGLEVINFVAYDAKGVPPTIRLAVNVPTNGGAEGCRRRCAVRPAALTNSGRAMD